MADSILINSAEEPIALSAAAVRKLLGKNGSGDAALLYLALLSHHGTVPPRALARELRWDRDRLESAEQVLRDLALIAPAAIQEPSEEPPEYQTDDITMRLEDSREFSRLVSQVEQCLGKKLTTPELGKLLGLYDFLGLPAHVIYQLVNHCAERAAQYGTGRKPPMWQIEREGYVWAKRGLYSQEAVESYLRYQSRQKVGITKLMEALRLGNRDPVEPEEQYLNAWLDMGFPPETVSLAYDRTVFRCHEFKWEYCNGVLTGWHNKGLHTPAEVQNGDTSPRKKKKIAQSEQDRIEEIRKYL